MWYWLCVCTANVHFAAGSLSLKGLYRETLADALEQLLWVLIVLKPDIV